MVVTIAELEEDGCNIGFFHALAQDAVASSASATTCNVRIPHSFYFEYARPRFWFYNARDSAIRKRGSKDFTVDDIRKALHLPSPSLSPSLPHHNHPSGALLAEEGETDSARIVAVLYSVPKAEALGPLLNEAKRTSSKRTSHSGDKRSHVDVTYSRHLTAVEVEDLLGGLPPIASKLPRRFLLQRFEHPQGWYNSVIRATRTSKVTVAECMRSRWSLRDAKKTASERGETFETPQTSTQTSVSTFALNSVKLACSHVADHLCHVMHANPHSLEMVLYFKVNVECEVVLLFTGSLRLAPRSVELAEVGGSDYDDDELLHHHRRDVLCVPKHDTPDRNPLNIWHRIASYEQQERQEVFDNVVDRPQVYQNLRALERKLRLSSEEPPSIVITPTPTPSPFSVKTKSSASTSLEESLLDLSARSDVNARGQQRHPTTTTTTSSCITGGLRSFIVEPRRRRSDHSSLPLPTPARKKSPLLPPLLLVNPHLQRPQLVEEEEDAERSHSWSTRHLSSLVDDARQPLRTTPLVLIKGTVHELSPGCFRDVYRSGGKTNQQGTAAHRRPLSLLPPFLL